MNATKIVGTMLLLGCCLIYVGTSLKKPPVANRDSSGTPALLQAPSTAIPLPRLNTHPDHSGQVALVNNTLANHALLAAPSTLKITEIRETIGDATYIWRAFVPPDTLRLLSNQVQLVIDTTDLDTPSVQDATLVPVTGNAPPVTRKTTFEGNVLTVPNLPPGRFKLTVSLKPASGDAIYSEPIMISVTTPGAPAVPTILGWTHSLYRKPDSIPDPSNVYAENNDANLRVSVAKPAVASGLEWWLLKETARNTTYEIISRINPIVEPVDRASDDRDVFRFTIPRGQIRENESGRLLAQSVLGGEHRMVGRQIPFSVKAPSENKTSVSITAPVPSKEETTNVGITYQQPLSNETFDLVLVNHANGMRTHYPFDTTVVSYKSPKLERNQENLIQALLMQGANVQYQSLKVPFLFSDRKPRITAFHEDGFGTIPNRNALTIEFGFEQKPLLDSKKVEFKDIATVSTLQKANAAIKLHRVGDPAATRIEIREIEYDESTHRLRLYYPIADVRPDTYRLTVPTSAVTDKYGNELEPQTGSQNLALQVDFGPQGIEYSSTSIPGVLPGIHGATGNYVAFQEFARPRQVPNGFNPNDKVETRVARLYFSRDAHRVAQIINRKVQSHNRHGVSQARQAAEQARFRADEHTSRRKQAEQEAIRLATETRETENELSDVRRAFDRGLNDLQNTAAKAGPTPSEDVQKQLKSMEAALQSMSTKIDSLQQKAESQRQAEVQANDRARQAEDQEELARQEQFRREVAAAHADPDTYAPGTLESDDPVEQVSISVIGEGLIHLRGPLKGINLIRLMIDQIDTPVGQCRVNVHSTQINGDEAEHLELVANRIQIYIDQARFMTMQTAEMLRKSVAAVAAQRAEDTRGMYPGATQAERDERYLYAFFGRDFADELRSIDSEFLHTGNKLLSLHSMDVTSLSSALLLVSLANNSTREMIMQEFHRQLSEELPCAEQRFLEASIQPSSKDCKIPILQAAYEKHHGPHINSLSQNAVFQSLHGFFDVQVPNDDTMTPLQREFIRLAQIFKSRLITELEYKQRVMERALIEERLGDRSQELQDARTKEKQAEDQLASANRQLASARQQVTLAVTRVVGVARASANVVETSRQRLTARFAPFVESISNPENIQYNLDFSNSPRAIDTHEFNLSHIGLPEVRYHLEKAVDGNGEFRTKLVITEDAPEMKVRFDEALAELEQLIRECKKYRYVTSNGKLLQEAGTDLARVREANARGATHPDPHRLAIPYDDLLTLARVYANMVRVSDAFLGQREQLEKNAVTLLQKLASDSDYNELYTEWTGFRSQIADRFSEHPQAQQITGLLNDGDSQFDNLLSVMVQAQFMRQQAESARRPLDHKKFLDMLIDDLEDKYIELLEGTRAHTANIDNYLKRLTTALDDDFNVQFYNPAFRSIREGSQFKDVEFGQTETTGVLANNREFAKVSPSATMEFDLPKRDILIKEGLDAALAIYDDMGALVNDPNLLSLARMGSGNSTASFPAGAGGGFGAVRDVLPGLQSSTGEDILMQNAGSQPRFESNVEKLIPDPAIYKFETGTGYEIRPVIQPDGQAVVFDFNYMYTTNVREPVRADEKHLGRVKRHFVDTDVQLSNFELREVSRYTVALKAERTGKGVPLLEDIPLIGVLWRPLPSAEKSLQQNIILAQSTIFPTLFDLMGLRWAPAVADLDPLRLTDREFLVRGRHRFLENQVYDISSARVDEFLRVPESQRRADLYRSQSTIPSVHPNGYRGPGLDYQDSTLREGYQPNQAYPKQPYIPDQSSEGSLFNPPRGYEGSEDLPIEEYPSQGLVRPAPSDPIRRLPTPIPLPNPAQRP